MLTWPELPIQVDGHWTLERAAFASYPSGATTALATRFVDSIAEVVAYESDGGGSWSGPVVLSPASASSPTIVVTGESTAVAAWQVESSHEIQVSTRSAEGTWSAPLVVSEHGVSAGSPHLARTSTGGVVLAYTKSLVGCAGDRCSQYGSDVGVVELPAGGAWSSTRWLTDDEGFMTILGLEVVPDGSVSVVVGWSNDFVHSDPYLEGVGVIRRPVAGDWQPVSFVYQLPNGAFQYTLGGFDVSDDGTVAATYSGSGSGPFVRTMSPTGILGSIVNLASVGVPAGYAPAASWASDGGLSVVWEGSAVGAPNPRFYEARRAVSGEWSSPIDVGLTAGTGRSGLARTPDDTLTLWSNQMDGSVRTTTRASGSLWQQPQAAVLPQQQWNAHSGAVTSTGNLVLMYTNNGTTWLQTGVRSTTAAAEASAPLNAAADSRDGASRVTWSAPASNGGAFITGYLAVASPGGRFCSTAPKQGAPAATACTITGLTNGVTYRISVRTLNGAGQSEPATSAPITPTGAPTMPRAVVIAPRSQALVVSWAAPANSGGLTVSRYVATAFPGGRTCTTTGTRTCTITGLANGSSYRVTVRAGNALGMGRLASAASLKYRVGAPSVPRALTITRNSATRTTLSWSAPSYANAGTVREYQVRWSSDGRIWSCWASTATRRTLTRYGLLVGKTYWVQVRAINVSGGGPAGVARFIR